MITIQGVNPNMIANNLEPAYPTHPGDVLNGKRQLNTEFALLIEAVLDLPAEPLLSMQARYNLITAKRNDKFVEKLNIVRRIASML